MLRAKSEEIAYSISVIFFFNMLAVIIFPVIGHMLHLSDYGFGLWDGTAVNDTSAVVAAGFAYSPEAGNYATIVKLTRTTLIIPLVLGFGLAMPWLDPAHRNDESHLIRATVAFDFRGDRQDTGRQVELAAVAFDRSARRQAQIDAIQTANFIERPLG